MADSISPTKDIRGQKTTEKKTRKANVSEVNKHGKSFQEKYQQSRLNIPNNDNVWATAHLTLPYPNSTTVKWLQVRVKVGLEEG